MLRVEVRGRGGIDRSWSDWFEGLEIVQASADQTAIHGDLPAGRAVDAEEGEEELAVAVAGQTAHSDDLPLVEREGYVPYSPTR